MQMYSKEKRETIRIFLIGFFIILAVVGIEVYFFQKQVSTPTPSLDSSQNLSFPTDVVHVTGKDASTLVVSETIDEDGLAADTKEFQPFVTYLADKLKPFGITRGKFVGVDSPSEMARLVSGSKVDIVIDSAFPVYLVSKLTGAELIADRWKGGVREYHSAIFVKQNSPIFTLHDLEGKILAFDSNTSTVGYFLPKAQLIKLGYTLTQVTSANDPCPATSICYLFVHGNVYDSVASGIVPAGAESELEIDDYFKDKIKDYRIILRSPDIIRFAVAVRQDMPSDMKDAIKSILINMSQTAEGNVVLKNFANTARFTLVDNSDKTYGVLADLSDLVEKEIIH